MSLRTFIGNIVFKIQATSGLLGVCTRFATVPTVKLEELELSYPRTEQEIFQAYNRGRIAEMTPKQAGL